MGLLLHYVPRQILKLICQLISRSPISDTSAAAVPPAKPPSSGTQYLAKNKPRLELGGNSIVRLLIILQYEQ